MLKIVCDRCKVDNSRQYHRIDTEVESPNLYRFQETCHLCDDCFASFINDFMVGD